MIEINLTGKTALVTGATRGIGFAIAQQFLKAGANLIVTGTRKTGEEALLSSLGATESNQMIEYVAADFTNDKSIRSFLSAMKSRSQLDICVNNAGINRIKSIKDVGIEDIQSIHSVNLYAPFLILSAVLPLMAKNRWGRVVNIGSLWSKLSRPGRALYSSSKHGLMGLTVTAALEYASSNILVNMVSPGFVLTDLTRSTLSEESRADIEKQIPIGKFAVAEDIAKVVVFLCSEMNSYVTGQNIIVDGGYICE